MNDEEAVTVLWRVTSNKSPVTVVHNCLLMLSY